MNTKNISRSTSITLRKVPAYVEKNSRKSDVDSRRNFRAVMKAYANANALILNGKAYDINGKQYETRAERDAADRIPSATVNYRAKKGVQYKKSIQHITAAVLGIPDGDAFAYAPMMFMWLNKEKLNKLQKWNAGYNTRKKAFMVTSDPNKYESIHEVFAEYRVNILWGFMLLDMGYTIDEIVLPLKYDFQGAGTRGFQKVRSIPGMGTRGVSNVNPQQLEDGRWAFTIAEMYRMIATPITGKTAVPYLSIYKLMFDHDLTCEEAIKAYAVAHPAGSRGIRFADTNYGWSPVQELFVNPVSDVHGREVYKHFTTMCRDFGLTEKQARERLKNDSLHDVLTDAYKGLKKTTSKKQAIR